MAETPKEQFARYLAEFFEFADSENRKHLAASKDGLGLKLEVIFRPAFIGRWLDKTGKNG